MKKADFQKIKTELIIGVGITVIGGIILAYFQFFLDSKKSPDKVVIQKANAFNIDLKEFYVLDTEEIDYIQDRDSSTWMFNDGVKMAGFYLTSYFNNHTGIKMNINVVKGQHYFCESYDMKSIAKVSGLSIHNPNVEQHEEVSEDYYNGKIADGFAYYNPEFIKWTYQNLIPNPTDKNSQNFIFQTIYNELYRNNVRLLVESYFYFQDEQSYVAAQNEYLKAMETSDFNGVEYLFNKYGDQTAYTPSLYNRHIAIGFWLRRGIDGTSYDVWQGIIKLMKLYDKEWFHNRSKVDKTVWENSAY